MSILYQEEKRIDRSDLLELYNDAGWLAYTRKIDELEAGIESSLCIITAREKNKLLGLIRIIGDGHTIVYIQDILVLAAYKRRGIGSKLMHLFLEKYPEVRQKILMTEDTEETRKFYEALDFESCDKGELVAFIKK